MPALSLDRLSGAGVNFVDALCDPKRQRRTVLGLVAVYAAAWTLYGVIAKSSQDINADMAEMVIWSRQLALGYPKHPPLLAYVVKAWFSVFPLADWAYTLLAVITVSAGLYLAFELAGIWLEREKRAAVPFLLAVIPFYNFLGLKFDQNSALIPLWALAIWAFLHALGTRRAGWAALAGLAAAAAILTKYWSAFLLIALALAALADRRRGVYLRSAAPWVTAIVFLLAILPHAIWLVRENFPPLTWVATRRTAVSAADFLGSLGEYLGGTIGYASLAIVLVAILVHPSGAAVRDSWFTRDPVRRPAMIVFWTPLLLPIAVAAVTRTNLLSLWSTPALNLLPVMMLASPLVLVSRRALARIAAVVALLTTFVVVISPFVALAILKLGVENDSAYAELVAAATEQQWRQTCNCPLRLVTGRSKLADPVAFYMTDRPTTYGDFSRYVSPWVDERRIAREGIAVVCAVDDDTCRETMRVFVARGPAGRQEQVTLTRRWLGFSGRAKRFIIATVPPRP